MDRKERICRLREYMESAKIDICIIPTADYHQSEYVGEHFKLREYLTGFTGSAGTAVFAKTEAGLWTDGRYFLQASRQLEGSGIELYRMGEPRVPSVEEFLRERLPDRGVLGVDGRTIGVNTGCIYEEIAKEKGGVLLYDIDIASSVWKEQPALSQKSVFSLPLKYTGKSTAQKLEQIRNVMKENKTDVHVLTSLDDIGWILNLRGQDVEYFPLFLSYMIIRLDTAELYAEERKFSEEIKRELKENKITILPYSRIYEQIKKLQKDTVLLDKDRVNYTLYRKLPGQSKIVWKENPEIMMKCVKNPTEVENIKRAHLKDGIAHTKFMYWLKKNAGAKELTELEASKKLEALRAEQEGFLWPSFAPICAYGKHGAIVHYSANEETNAQILEGGLLLTDTGGNYLEGSTDITRTVAIGEVSQEEKNHFTLVAAGMLRLSAVRFLYGCSGANLDYAAREPFWRESLNFNHGTGHGVGYLGNIHEPPIGFRWKCGKSDMHPLEENMVITDEPGIYIEGSYGIRLENELLVRAGEKNEYGQFMYFETLTFVPIDLDAINPEKLEEREKELLNVYHAEVYRNIAPYLSEEERSWLKEYTRSI
ncbi:aminopeptidase P family protein [Mediterraneibacter sp. NSJ-55]|uniref:Aminopeptidase P family protein n=1 Tax=Mediterraneibacter hominis TaxID=2763054 RepID=A0A923LFS0_9FIRM|nr:aminopeptidase P family protein [Mediterraneibacter hominis]MBC5687892.1 aminopeptidase P family protein [Mediterraneibacter hominis]